MAFFIAFAIVERDQGVGLQQLAEQLKVLLHQATIEMEHVELGSFGSEELEHLGAAALHHLRFAAFRQLKACKGLLGAGMHVAGDQAALPGR